MDCQECMTLDVFDVNHKAFLAKATAGKEKHHA